MTTTSGSPTWAKIRELTPSMKSPAMVDLLVSHSVLMLFFPLLVCIAYAGDKGLLHKLFGQKKTEDPEAPEQLALGESKILQ